MYYTNKRPMLVDEYRPSGGRESTPEGHWCEKHERAFVWADTGEWACVSCYADTLWAKKPEAERVKWAEDRAARARLRGEQRSWTPEERAAFQKAKWARALEEPS